VWEEESPFVTLVFSCSFPDATERKMGKGQDAEKEFVETKQPAFAGWLFENYEIKSAGVKPERLGRVEAELGLGTLGIGLGLAPGFLRWRLESAQTTDFVHDALGIEFALETFESTVDRLSFANDNFRHCNVPSADGLKSESG
jgi:hypothetical protein